jgi:tetratricopeptide (TPR) repeat protein
VIVGYSTCQINVDILTYPAHKISPGTVTILAGILRRCRQHKQHILATQLMLSASLLGDKSATFELIHSAIKTGKLGQFAEPLQQLGVLAKKNNDPEAMMLLGKVLLSQEKDQEALGWLQKSTRPPTGSQEISGAGDAILNEALVLLRLGRKEEGEEAIRKAALELDEPAAYFYLSHLVEPGSSVQRVYLLKAASSGVREACHNLGALELAEIEKKSQKPTSFQDYGMAREWFQVAAADGFGLSMMNLALMYKAVGEEEESMRWIQKALEIPEVKEQALDLERQWDKERANLH